jgi:hypothetical protein
VDRALVHLEDAGTIRRHHDDWTLDQAALADAARVLAALAGADSHEAPPLVAPDGRPLSAEESKVIRSFVVDGRLVSIPAHGRKREIVLRWLLEAVFVEDRDYPEAEVNQRLALFHRDVASLRRYLVDSALVARDHGLYRRRAPAGVTP